MIAEDFMQALRNHCALNSWFVTATTGNALYFKQVAEEIGQFVRRLEKGLKKIQEMVTKESAESVIKWKFFTLLFESAALVNNRPLSVVCSQQGTLHRDIVVTQNMLCKGQNTKILPDQFPWKQSMKTDSGKKSTKSTTLLC